MTNAQDQDNDVFVLNLTDNPVVTYPVAPQAFHSAFKGDTGSSRVFISGQGSAQQFQNPVLCLRV